MVTQITLGNVINQNGKTVLSGGQSGIDSQSLVKALGDAKRLPAVKLEDKVKLNEKKLTAFNDLKSILSRFKDASNFLRNPPGFQSSDQNIFQYRTGSVQLASGASGEAFVAATVKPGTQIQNYTINEVSQLAQAAKQESNALSAANPDASVVATPAAAGSFGAGVITLKGLTPAGVSITLNNGDSLRTVVSKFNAVKDQTGISASTLQVAQANIKSSTPPLRQDYPATSTWNLPAPYKAILPVHWETSPSAPRRLQKTRYSNSIITISCAKRTASATW